MQSAVLKGSLPAWLIFALGLAVYSNTFHCSFQFDDSIYIVGNPSIHHLQDLQAIWKFCPCRFLAFLSIAINYHLHQLHVLGYHLVNLAIHVVCALLVWRLVLLTFWTPVMKAEKISRHAGTVALFAGLLFVSHPVQTEAVTYIWQRATSLMTMFYLASLTCYITSRLKDEQELEKAGARAHYGWALAAALAAMFTKENAITLPIIIGIYEFYFFKSPNSLRWQKLWPFVLTLAIIPLTTLLTSTARVQEIKDVVQGPSGISPIFYLLTEFRVMMTYLRLLVLPVHQNVDYDYPISLGILEPPTLASFLMILLLLAAARRLYPRFRLLSFSILWFFLTLLPDSSFLPLEDVIFEHRMYLPLVGYGLLLAGALPLVMDRRIRTWVLIASLVIAGNAVATYQRNKVWRNEFTLWYDALRKSPNKARPYNRIGNAYLNQGRMDTAVQYFDRAIQLNPRDAKSYINRGCIYGQKGQLLQAISDFSRAIGVDPVRFPEAYYDRGGTFYQLKDYGAAWRDVRKAGQLGFQGNPAFVRELGQLAGQAA